MWPAEFLDFRNFLWRCHQCLRLLAPTRLQYDLGEWMQHGPVRKVALCFRGFGKSHLASLFGDWRLGCDREDKFLQTSASRKKSDDATRFMLDLIRIVPELKNLYPEREQRRSNVEFDVNGCLPAHAPSVRSLGITSNAIVGSRAGAFCADDVESKANSQTPTMRERVRDICRELGGAILRSEVEIENPCALYLGTPQLEDSLYFTLPEAGYEIRIYPIRYPDPKTRDVYGNMLAPILAADLDRCPSLAGQPTEPLRFPESVIRNRQAEYGKHGFALQFMLLPSLADADRYPLKLNDISVMDLDVDVGPEKVVWSSSPELALTDLPNVGFRRDWWRRPIDLVGKLVPYQSGVMAIDPSSTGADECAYAVAKALNSQVFLLDVGGFKIGNSEDTFRALARIARRWKIGTVLVEQNFSGGMWPQLFRPILRELHPGCVVEEVPVHGQKEKRVIEILDPVMDSHRLVVNKAAIQNDHDSTQDYPHGSLEYQCFYQMSRLTPDRGCLEHEDRLEAVALAVAHFSDTMSRDFEMEIESRKSEELDTMLEQWDERLLMTPGRQHQPQGWITRR